MSIGSFISTQRQSKKSTAPTPKKKPDQGSIGAFVPPSTLGASAVTEIRILLVGRDRGAIGDFLCSLNENASVAFNALGMSYFTRDAASSSAVIETKKQLERFFWDFKADVRYLPPEQALSAPADPFAHVDPFAPVTEEQSHTFALCPSGNQKNVLSLTFNCLEYGAQLPMEQIHADALWILADGGIMIEEEATDSGVGYVAGLLSSIPPASEQSPALPVCLLMTSLENKGHYDNGRLSERIAKAFYKKANDLFAGRAAVPVALFPLQVYGGLQYFGKDEKNQPILKSVPTGYYQSYIPEGCHLPLIYTLDKTVEARGTDFFTEGGLEGLKKSLRRYYASVLGSKNWTPDLLSDAKED